jgi:hypothetical protein
MMIDLAGYAAYTAWSGGIRHQSHVDIATAGSVRLGL